MGLFCFFASAFNSAQVPWKNCIPSCAKAFTVNKINVKGKHFFNMLYMVFIFFFITIKLQILICKYQFLPQHFLYLSPLPQGQGEFLPSGPFFFRNGFFNNLASLLLIS